MFTCPKLHGIQLYLLQLLHDSDNKSWNELQIQYIY